MIELLNIDCMEYMATLSDKAFDLAIVDPPYGLNATVNGNGSRNKIYDRGVGKKWDTNKPSEKYFLELARVATHRIVWGANYFMLPSCRCFIVWDKIQPESVTFSMAELAYTTFESKSMIFRGTARSGERIHPTQKPVDLYSWLLHNYAKPGQKILDTHLGSGSSAIAAHYFGCDFVGCELDKDYYDAAVKRFEQRTAQTTLFEMPT